MLIVILKTIRICRTHKPDAGACCHDNHTQPPATSWRSSSEDRTPSTLCGFRSKSNRMWSHVHKSVSSNCCVQCLRRNKTPDMNNERRRSQKAGADMSNSDHVWRRGKQQQRSCRQRRHRGRSKVTLTDDAPWCRVCGNNTNMIHEGKLNLGRPGTRGDVMKTTEEWWHQQEMNQSCSRSWCHRWPSNQRRKKKRAFFTWIVQNKTRKRSRHDEEEEDVCFFFYSINFIHNDQVSWVKKWIKDVNKAGWRPPATRCDSCSWSRRLYQGRWWWFIRSRGLELILLRRTRPVQLIGDHVIKVSGLSGK